MEEFNRCWFVSGINLYAALASSLRNLSVIGIADQLTE